MRTTWMMMTMLSVWALPVHAERNEVWPAISTQDAPHPVMAVNVGEADRPRSAPSGNPLHRSVREQVRRVVPKLGPAPKVHLSAERIADAVRTAEARGGGAVLTVDCTGEGDSATIQGAIDAASDGDIIIVLPNTCTDDGHYFENINFFGKAITVQSLEPTNPGIVAATVIDGSTNDLSTVTFASGETAESALDGLTITGGSGTPVERFPEEFPGLFYHFGGGIFIDSSDPIIRHCRVVNNHATWGAGIEGINASPIIAECLISGNHAFTEIQPPDGSQLALFANGGGLAFMDESFPAVSRCGILNNIVHADHDYGSWPPENGFGGGLALWFENEAAGAAISNCLISGNVVTSDPSISFPDGLGGGILVAWSGDVSVINTMIAENEAPESGAIYGGFTMLGCTVTRNETVSNCGSCGAARMWGTFRNGIIHGNVNGDLGSPFEPTVMYSNVDTMSAFPFPGEGNIDADPLFVDPNSGDYHLTVDSPCVDAGDPEFVPQEGETDIDGDPRVVGERVDMGADEFGPPDLCADDDGDGRVTVCHFAPGNNENAHTITVGVRAVPAHLAHGDHCGPCE